MGENIKVFYFYHIMKSLVFHLVMALLGFFFGISSRKKAKIDSEGNKILKLSVGYGIIGIFSLSIVLLIIVLDISWIVTSKTIPTVVYVVQTFLFLFFGSIGIGLVLATWNAKIICNEDSIICKTWLGNIKTIKWAEVKSAEYYARFRDLRISNRKVEIICEEHLKGFIDLTEFIEKKTGITRERMSLPKNLIRPLAT